MPHKVKSALFSRRNLFALLALSWLSASIPARADAVDATQAASFITNSGNQLVALINQGADSPSRRQALQVIVDRDIDVDGVGKFCLGRFWRAATPEQQADYTTVFHSVLMRAITANLGDYQGVTFTVGQVSPGPNGGMAVETVLTRPNNAPNNVQWVVVNSGGSLKVADVIVEGTSLRLTKRNEYSSYLQNNGNDINALITALKAQSSN